MSLAAENSLARDLLKHLMKRQARRPRCTICRHPDAVAIDRALGLGSALSVARDFGLSDDAVWRHARRHLGRRAFGCGHPRSEGNITRWGDRTYCRTCQADRARARYRATPRRPKPPRTTFRCGHPIDLWNTYSRTSEGKTVRRCRECTEEKSRAAVKRSVESGRERERMRRRSELEGRARPDLWRDALVSCRRCGLIRMPYSGKRHSCTPTEYNWNGILCPACGAFKCQRRMKDALCAEHGGIGMLYYLRDPDYRQKVIDAAKHRSHLKRAAQARGEVITLAALIARDGDACYICGETVSDDLPFTHPLKANIDHVVPISKGGQHTLGNVRVACRSCNAAKGAKVAA